MRPFSGRSTDEKLSILNYRLSRARRIIENSFDILSARWQVYQKAINMHPKYVDSIIIATVCLHNFLRSDGDEVYCPPAFVDTEDTEGNIIPGEWRQIPTALMNMCPTTTHNATKIAYKNRDILAEYFTTRAGEVPWQHEYVRRGQYRDSLY